MITVKALFMMNEREIELPDGATAADLLKYYPYKGIYMMVDGKFLMENFDQYELHHGDTVRLLRYLAPGG